MGKLGLNSGYIGSDQRTTTNGVVGYDKYYLERANGGFNPVFEGDPDAQAFFQRVVTAGGTLSATEQLSIDTLVKQMKLDGIWTKMKAIYPMVGASAAACAQNLKSSSFTGTFNGGWTFASTGVTPNGTNGFFDTTFIPSVEFSGENASFGVYSRTVGTVNAADFGRANGGGAIITYLSVTSPNNIATWNGGSGYVQGGTGTKNGLGFYNFQRLNSTTINVFENASKVINVTDAFVAWPNLSLPFGAYLFTTSFSPASNGSVRNLAFAFIGYSLTDTEAPLFYNSVQSFQTTLGRQVL
jgi:hypothetical protein